MIQVTTQMLTISARVSWILTIACDGACATCYDTGNKQCETCETGYMEVIDLDPSARWCVQTTCPNGYYPHSAT